MATAICIQCGESKGLPWKRCRRCAFDPTTSKDALVRSVYFSTGRFDDEEDAARYERVLDDHARTIRGGGSVEVDSIEYARLAKQQDAVQTVGWRKILGLFWGVFRPAVIFLLALLALNLAARFLFGR